MQFPYSITSKTFTVYIDGRAYQTDRSNPNWNKIKELVNQDNPDVDYLVWLVQPINHIEDALRGHRHITIQNGQVFYGTEQINNALTQRMLDVMGEGLSIEPWIKFAENVYANPAPFARDELYLFLEHADLPITPDGCFIAYKIVRGDYMDEYSGTLDNSIGNLVVMPGGRQAVDPNRHNTCSYGLHFCSKGYLPSYGSGGSRVVLVKINPADVVSIPSDYNNTKGRTWRYEVVGEITKEEAGLVAWRPVESNYNGHSWGWSKADESVELEDSDEDYVIHPNVREVTEAEVAEIQANVFAPLDLGVDDEFTRLLAEEAAIEAATIANLVQTAQDEADDAEYEATLCTSDDPTNHQGDTCPIHESDEPVIESVAHGTITRQRFIELRDQYGSLNKMAKALGQSAGTIQSWKTKLFGKANG